MVIAFRVVLILCFIISFVGVLAEQEGGKNRFLLSSAVCGTLFIATYALGM